MSNIIRVAMNWFTPLSKQTFLIMNKELLIELKILFKDIFISNKNDNELNEFLTYVELQKYTECKLKYSWYSGENISFACGFFKNGTKDYLTAFIEAIENKQEVFSFIHGLNPSIFKLKSDMIVNKPDVLFITFELKR